MFPRNGQKFTPHENFPPRKIPAIPLPVHVICLFVSFFLSLLSFLLFRAYIRHSDFSCISDGVWSDCCCTQVTCSTVWCCTCMYVYSHVCACGLVHLVVISTVMYEPIAVT